MARATKSQFFSAFLEVSETSTNQISRWYHEPLQNHKKSKFIVRSNFSCSRVFFSLSIFY